MMWCLSKYFIWLHIVWTLLMRTIVNCYSLISLHSWHYCYDENFAQLPLGLDQHDSVVARDSAVPMLEGLPNKCRSAHKPILSSILPLLPVFALLILYCNPAFWLAERAPGSFSHRAENKWFCMALFSFQDSRHYEENTRRQNSFNILNCGQIWKIKCANRFSIFLANLLV